jgi:acyl-CoA reductase-like NAD-dependent aldehyde dehydrogenase
MDGAGEGKLDSLFPHSDSLCIYCSLTSEMLPQVWAPLVAFPADAQVVPEPLGVVLIFSCWNFPLGKHFALNRYVYFFR